MTLPTINSTPPSGMPSAIPSPVLSGATTPNLLLGQQRDQHMQSSNSNQAREDRRAAQEAPDGGKGRQRWKIYLGRGIINDIKRRVPHYHRDWLDAWDYRVVPATVYIYFAKCVSSWVQFSPGNLSKQHFTSASVLVGHVYQDQYELWCQRSIARVGARCGVVCDFRRPTIGHCWCDG